MDSHNLPLISHSPSGESPRESPLLHPCTDNLLGAPNPASLQLSVTPSATTVTLPTPDAGHAQLVGGERYRPLRFIFYPISWDGSEDHPESVGADRFFVPDNIDAKDTTAGLTFSGVPLDGVDEDRIELPNAQYCSEDAFQSIDRWRRDVVKCNSRAASELLEPIQDVDAPLPLLSLPHDSRGASLWHPELEEWRPRPFHRNTDNNDGEDEVRLWVYP